MKCRHCEYIDGSQYNYNLKEFVNIDGKYGSFYSCEPMGRFNKAYNPPINCELSEEVRIFGCPRCGYVFIELKD